MDRLEDLPESARLMSLWDEILAFCGSCYGHLSSYERVSRLLWGLPDDASEERARKVLQEQIESLEADLAYIHQRLSMTDYEVWRLPTAWIAYPAKKRPDIRYGLGGSIAHSASRYHRQGHAIQVCPTLELMLARLPLLKRQGLLPELYVYLYEVAMADVDGGTLEHHHRHNSWVLFLPSKRLPERALRFDSRSIVSHIKVLTPLFLG